MNHEPNDTLNLHSIVKHLADRLSEMEAALRRMDSIVKHLDDRLSELETALRRMECT